jgi:hypothetical protein
MGIIPIVPNNRLTIEEQFALKNLFGAIKMELIPVLFTPKKKPAKKSSGNYLLSPGCIKDYWKRTFLREACRADGLRLKKILLNTLSHQERLRTGELATVITEY